jgi:hypothetical protein
MDFGSHDMEVDAPRDDVAPWDEVSEGNEGRTRSESSMSLQSPRMAAQDPHLDEPNIMMIQVRPITSHGRLY